MGIFGELRDKIGSPYDTFPAAMMKYGGGGVAGWGTLCGALNGAAAAIYMVNDKDVGNQIISELFGWYGQETLPNYTPTSPKYPEIVSSVAESQLCHVSVSKWCEESGFKATSPERAERCAWLTASVAKYTAELLNKQTEGTFSLVHAVPAGVQQCLACHGKDGVKENVHSSKATSCNLCHFGLGTEHP